MKHSPAPYSERIVFDASSATQEFAFIKTQDASAIVRAAKDAREFIPRDRGPARGRFLGTVPLLLAQIWSKECGAPVGSKEWAIYAKKKLKSNEWADLRVHG